MKFVNYFGHAAVASWRTGAAGVALGAMIPDFSTMAAARVASALDPDVAAGIDLHHATDAVFHALPAITAQMRELDARLDRLGCARGPRRAVAHVGVELLLDGVLVDDAAYRVAYERALAHDPAPALIWREPDGTDRFTRGIAKLRAIGVPHDLRDPTAVTARLARILGPRPLLAPSPADLVAIHRALVDHQPRLAIGADAILRGLRASLA